MRSPLLRECQEVEGRPRPLREGPTGSLDREGDYPCSCPCFPLENPASPAPPSPSTIASYLSPALRDPLPAASASAAAPHTQPPEAPPPRLPAASSAFIRANRRLASPSPAPIRAVWRRAFSNTFQLLPRPQDPFCLERARPGLSLHHFREEAPTSGPGLRVGTPFCRPTFHNFPTVGGYSAGLWQHLRVLP